MKMKTKTIMIANKTIQRIQIAVYKIISFYQNSSKGPIKRILWKKTHLLNRPVLLHYNTIQPLKSSKEISYLKSIFEQTFSNFVILKKLNQFKSN